MSGHLDSPDRKPSVMVLGVGGFAYSTAQILRDNGANVSTYFTRSYSHFPPTLAGPTYSAESFPSPRLLW